MRQGRNVVYGTLRTNRGLLDEALGARAKGEAIRFWDERSRWGEDSFPLWRVYSATWEGSQSTAVLQRSKNCRSIARDALEEAVGLPIARSLWEGWEAGGDAKTPALVVMSGPPLSGKTTLAKGIIDRAAEPAILVENDEIRTHVSREMGAEVPRFTIKEHRMTYNVSWELIRIGLAHGCHIVFDATNQTDRGREGAYAAAAERGAKALVIFVSASPEVIRSRFEAASPARRRAFGKLGSRRFTPRDCSVPFVELETARSPDTILRELVPDCPIPLRL